MLIAMTTAVAATALSAPASAFKVGTHVATANETVAQLELQITGGLQPDTITFSVNGRPLNVVISAKEAYQAVIEKPDFFRAGVTGPDGFPDPFTGQMLMHGNEAPMLKDLVEQVTGTPVVIHTHHDAYENRDGPVEFRSIDFATAMLEFFATYAPSGDERKEILAFMMGYISHGIGDSFSHTWVNQLAGGAWSMETGSGIWGSLSEEVKHVAIEGYIDSLVPDHLLSVAGDGGGRGRVTMSAPVAFLDAFYSSRPAHAPPPPQDQGSTFDGFAQFFGNVNQFHGGPFYSYFNAQVALAPSIKGWSRLGGFFDLAEDVRNNAFVNFGLDAAELPADLLDDLGVNAASWVDELTFGFADCHADQGGSNVVEEIRTALEYVGGINDRLDRHTRHAEIVRRNWILLSQCSSQNLGKVTAADFDPDQPTLNTDACADVVRAGWQDEGNAGGLYRGSVRPGSPVDDDFLLRLKAAFLGGDAEALFAGIADPTRGDAPWHDELTLESANGHRSMRGNLTREMDYLIGFGFRADDLKEVILPEKEVAGIRDSYNEFCGAVRDPAFENCLDLAFAPIAAAARHATCVGEHVSCVLENTTECLQNVCTSACGLIPGDCDEICGVETNDACQEACVDVTCPGYIEGLPPPPPPFCSPGAFLACRSLYCPIFDNERPNCAETAVDQFHCDLESVACNFDAMKETIELDNYAEELLTPARQACDTIDDTIAFIECLEGDPTKTPGQQAADRRTCVIDRCDQLSDMTNAECAAMYDDLADAYAQAERIKDALSQAADALRERPAHEVVNLAFLEEDLRDPGYLADIRDAIDAARDDLSTNPPGPGATPDEVARYNRKMAVLDRWETLLDDVEDAVAPPAPLADIGNAAEDAGNLIADSVALGLIPAVLGPTAQRILSDVGPSFTDTFLPFFNSVQGMKLAPMTSQDDIEGLFTRENVSAARLPWNAAGVYSAACAADTTSLYCDALKSFDDPNCMNCNESDLDPDPVRFNWIRGRGPIAWNEYDATAPERHVTTNFPLASSDPAYDSLYTRVFQVPLGVPGFAGFDDPAAPWTSDEAGLGSDFTQFTEGSSSLQLNGCNFMAVESPFFLTADWQAVGDRLQFDLFVPSSQPNPFWVGGIQVMVTIPGANIFSLPIPAWTNLTTLPRGAWSTIEFVVPPNVKAALLGDFADAQLRIEVTTASCQDPLLLDNLRFGGDVTERETYHLRGSQIYQVVTNPLFSFDNAGDWSAPVPLSTSSERVEGTGSVAFTAGGHIVVTSRPFNTSELSGVTRNLSVDVFIPERQPNQWWNGDIQVFLTCGPHNNLSLGVQSFVNRFDGEFNTVEFLLPTQVASTLGGNFQNCRVSLAMNVNPAGQVRLDNMGFH
ncbi:hypothetical protein BE08_40100 [Sorangium cellulosum]|uniref:Uncharacterized protein n=1 Tax=Sorangium cellulosum TaxID=56 RepID=A0A150PH27_SORCE|nr:hypothetical protein BE08_40100 [Sorangium cellulosum]